MYSALLSGSRVESSCGLALKSAFLMRLLQRGRDVADCLLVSILCETASAAEIWSSGFEGRFPCLLLQYGAGQDTFQHIATGLFLRWLLSQHLYVGKRALPTSWSITSAQMPHGFYKYEILASRSLIHSGQNLGHQSSPLPKGSRCLCV